MTQENSIKNNTERMKNNNYKISLFPHSKTKEEGNHHETILRYLHHIQEQYSTIY